MNIVLGFIVIVVLTCMDTSVPTTVIDSFHTASESASEYSASSYDCGLREGDKIIEIDGMDIMTVNANGKEVRVLESIGISTYDSKGSSIRAYFLRK